MAYPPCETPQCPECGRRTSFRERTDAPFRGGTEYSFACVDYCDVVRVFVRDADWD